MFQTMWDRWNEAFSHANTISVRPVIAIQYRLVTDRQTDRQTDRHTTTANAALILRKNEYTLHFRRNVTNGYLI